MPLKKDELRKILSGRDWAGLERFWEENKSAQRILLSAMFEDDALVRWRGIEALGFICAKRFDNSPEWVKGIVRHFIWGMNDESGNLIWHAPEAISEILVRIPTLINEYALILASQIETEPFPAGVYLAMARISFNDSEIFDDYREYLRNSLNSANPQIAVCSYICLRNMGENLTADFPINPSILANTLILYNFRTGGLEEWTVGDFISQTEIKVREYFLY